MGEAMDSEVRAQIEVQFAGKDRMFGGLIMPGRCYVGMRITDDIILIEQGSAPPGPVPAARQAQMDDEKFWALNWLVTICKNDADIFTPGFTGDPIIKWFNWKEITNGQSSLTLPVKKSAVLPW